MKKIDRALSIRQPWSWLIVHGFKNIENRTWITHHRGPFHVHASSSLFGTIAERERIRVWVRRRFGITVPEDDELPIGGIVGKANIVDVVSKHRSAWFVGPVGFVLTEARPSRFRPMRGALGFFTV
jgi:hypothetical protein